MAKTTHGLSRHPLYNTFIQMHYRCYDENNPNYKWYGAKGIGVCERWHSIENFIEDMGERPAGCSLDRINTTKGYSPDNCKWSTAREQALNRGDRSDRRSPSRGVYYVKRTGKYQAQIMMGGKLKTLITTDDLELAEFCFQEAEEKRTNLTVNAV